MLEEYLKVGLILFAFACLRYIIMTGTYYVVVTKFFDRYLNPFKINPKRSSKGNIYLEVKWALINNINFFLIGMATYFLYVKGLLKIYFDWNEYGTLYALLSIPLLLLIHDTYFYWLHYVMHYTKLRKYMGHEVHHQVQNVSAWSAFSVHPVEGFFEVLLRPIILLVFPMHPYTFIAFAILSFSLNIIGHSGYEFFPKNFATSPLTKFNSCATFHYMHHKYPGHNLSLFFNYWDRIMGTLHPKYVEFYEQTRGAIGNSKQRNATHSNLATSKVSNS